MADAKKADDWEDVPLEDDWQDVPESTDSLDPYYKKAAAGLEGIGGQIMSGIGAASRAVDKYTGAPVRAAVGAAQEGRPILQAYGQQFGEDPALAPTGKQIASRLGLSEEEFHTPLITNPFTDERLKVSPAGVAGGVIETALDPTTYIPGKLAASGLARGAGVVERNAPRLAESAARFAEERAVKAATGESRAAIKKLAKVKGQSAGDVDRALANLRGAGRTLLEADDAGAPAVGWLSTPEDIGRNAAAKKQFYGKRIGETGDVVDKLAPGAVTPQAIAADVGKFQKDIPNVGKGAPVRKRVGEEAERLRSYGLAEEEFGPAKPLGFREAQELKGQYPWEPMSSDVLISDKDATSNINRIISRRMDEAVERAKAGNPTPEDLKILNQYAPAKQKYGVYKDIGDAGTQQALNTVSRRMVSPSSHGIGGAVGISAAEATDSLAKGGLYGLGAAAINQQILSRGSAFGARSADAISRKLMSAPQVYQKWLPIMQKAAQAGNAAVLSTHHQLMNSDPEYRALMFQKAEEGP